jgi:two-component system sensor histidine kinase PilS (NtrC family)
LGAISHAGQLLAECPDLSKADLRLAEIIQAHALRVNSIIEDILQLSRRTDSKQERIHLATWLPEYLALFEIENRGHIKQFTLSVAEEVQDILFDPGHLTQILNNLCENALKYGYAPDQDIELKVTTFFNQPCLQVIDHGKNISKATKEHLFEPFFTTSNSGTGLGLYISRELAELNQASLTDCTQGVTDFMSNISS